jgi:hypothetical protein
MSLAAPDLRYHPYAKPTIPGFPQTSPQQAALGALAGLGNGLAGLGGNPFQQGPNSAAAAALAAAANPYYSSYSALYAAAAAGRIGL